MEKQTRVFAIVVLMWLFVLDGAIVRSVYEKYSVDRIVYTKNVLTGSAISYSASSEALFYKVLVPMILFNIFVLVFLSLSFYYYKKKKLYGWNNKAQKS